MVLQAPVLSELDLLLESEGSVDPLGLQAVYERLADKILPAITVRMTRPRFLTAMAVGAHVCQQWGEEDLAADQVSPAWIVFEWFVVESFYRSREKLTDDQRIAGILKAGQAIRDHDHLSAPTYLKSPKVCGCSGVFKRLAVAAGVLTEDFTLDEAGFTLVRAWEQDRGLGGFLDSRDGPGATFRSRLRTAVSQGMENGRTTKQSTAFWEELAGHLQPGGAAQQEKAALYNIVRSGSRRDRSTGELVGAIEAHGRLLEWRDEATFLGGLHAGVSEELRAVLVAIDTYERLCRPVLDAFNGIRHLSSKANHGPVGASEFLCHPPAADLVTLVKRGLDGVGRCTDLLDWEPGVRDLADQFRDVETPAQLFDRVVARHEEAQRAKPPHGKRPWLERERGGAVIVRPAYAMAELPEDMPAYVHEYRMPTLSRFLRDLGRVN